MRIKKEIVVKDLYKLLNEISEQSFEIVRGPIALLEDSSEICGWYIIKEGKSYGIIIAHYIDNYYLALSKLHPLSSDEDVIKALIETGLGSRWAVPVEPVIITTLDKSLILHLEEYSDSYPAEEAINALREYNRNPKSLGALKDRLLSYLGLT
jgi:hypothetical protein